MHIAMNLQPNSERTQRKTSNASFHRFFFFWTPTEMAVMARARHRQVLNFSATLTFYITASHIFYITRRATLYICTYHFTMPEWNIYYYYFAIILLCFWWMHVAFASHILRCTKAHWWRVVYKMELARVNAPKWKTGHTHTTDTHTPGVGC